MMQWILIGLGNPGKFYESHRHNAGFMMLEKVRCFFGFLPFQKKATVLLTKGLWGEHAITLCCPLLYMNLSGQALVSFLGPYKEARWLVCHDELDLPLGVVRWKRGGSAGGHNGLRNIHQFLGSTYERIRIGIGRPAPSEAVASYVLSPFSRQEQTILESRIHHFIALLPTLLAGEEALFLQKLHTSSTI